MHFSSNGIGRKNGYRFDIRYGSYLDGEAQENKWYLYCSRPVGKNIYNEGTYTERTLRFPTQEAAQAYCERIASGEVSLAELKKNEDLAWEAHTAREQDAAEKQVDVFLDRMKELGVNPILVPDILRAYNDMLHGPANKAVEAFNRRLDTLREQEASAQPVQLTLGDFLKVYQQDIDICLVDSETGEHLLPALVYLSEEELLKDEFGYDDWETWIMSQPLDHTINNRGCTLAVVNTGFDWDQTCFLLGQNDFEKSEWSQLAIRASWAGADFKDRLAYLSDGKSFERSFDGSCMDAVDPDQRKKLVSMLDCCNQIFVAPYPEESNVLYAYSYHFNKKGNIRLDGDVDIRLTEPGKGLVSTLDGKVAWTKYTARQAAPEAHKAPAKSIDAEKER